MGAHLHYNIAQGLKAHSNLNVTLCDQAHKMHDIFVIVLELHLQKHFLLIIKSSHTQDLHHKFPLCHTITPSFKIIRISCYCFIPYKRSTVS